MGAWPLAALLTSRTDNGRRVPAEPEVNGLYFVAHSSAAEVAAAPPSPVPGPSCPAQCPAGRRSGRICAGICRGGVSERGGGGSRLARRSVAAGLLFGSEGNARGLPGRAQRFPSLPAGRTRGAGLGRGERPRRDGHSGARYSSRRPAPPGSAAGGCAPAPGPAPEPPGRPSPPCAPGGGGGAPFPPRPWRGAAGRATRPSSCRRPSAPCSSPAGRSSATRSASSAASAAWPRKPASARSGPPRYRPCAPGPPQSPPVCPTRSVPARGSCVALHRPCQAPGNLCSL